MLLAAVQSCGCAPQRAPAAAMSRSRALAPTCCIFSRDNLTEWLPYEDMSP